MDAQQAITVFGAMFALDFVWAFYTRSITENRALHAALAASGIIVLSGAAAIGYVQNPTMLVPAAAGAFAGTYLSMRILQKPKVASADVIFRMLCTRRHVCRTNEPCNGLPRDPTMSAEFAESYNENL